MLFPFYNICFIHSLLFYTLEVYSNVSLKKSNFLRVDNFKNSLVGITKDIQFDFIVTEYSLIKLL